MADAMADYEILTKGFETTYRKCHASGFEIKVTAWRSCFADVAVIGSKWRILCDENAQGRFHVGCEFNTAEGWRGFFRDGRFFETDPEKEPDAYNKIIEAFELAVKWVEDNDFSVFEYLGEENVKD